MINTMNTMNCVMAICWGLSAYIVIVLLNQHISSGITKTDMTVTSWNIYNFYFSVIEDLKRLLSMSNFSICYNVFKVCLLQKRQKALYGGKGYKPIELQYLTYNFIMDLISMKYSIYLLLNFYHGKSHETFAQTFKFLQTHVKNI